MTTPSEPGATSKELLTVSRLIGADALFEQLVEKVATQATGVASVGDADARQRIRALHDELRLACAAIYLQRVGPERAALSLAALASAPVQRYLVARRLMAPALAQQLLALKQRMGNIET